MSLSGRALFNLSNTGSTHIKPQSVHTPTGTVMTEYEEYLKSNHWHELKVKSVVLWGSKCLVCASEMHIERHHIFYRDNLCDGKPSEIIPLCSACHEAAHIDGSNKNGQPSDREALKRLIDRLFYQIVRVRGLLTERIRLSHGAFWKRFDYCVDGSIPKKWNQFNKVKRPKKVRDPNKPTKKERKREERRLREIKRLKKAEETRRQHDLNREAKMTRRAACEIRTNERLEPEVGFSGRVLGD